MRLVQKISEYATDIIKHPLEIMLVLGLSTAIGCQSINTSKPQYLENPVITQVKSPIIKYVENNLRELPGDYQPKYSTTTHRSIKMSKELGATAQDYNILDDIIEYGVDKVEEYITEKGYNAIQVLNIIGNVVDEYSDDTGERSHPLLIKALYNRNLDCDKKSLLYKAIGETMNLPMHMMYIPEHVFIRLYCGEDYIDWETTANDFFNYKFEWFKDKINKHYPKQLNQEEILAIQFLNRGISWMFQKDITGLDYIRILFDYDMAIELFPEFWDAHYYKAIYLMNDNKSDKAINEFSTAINLWKNDVISHNYRGLCYIKEGEYVKAIEDFNKAIELKEDFWQAFSNRAMAYSEIGEHKKSAEDLNESLRLRDREKDK